VQLSNDGAIMAWLILCIVALVVYLHRVTR